MSGHSKWSTIKRQKGANDARRGQLFTKLGREISGCGSSGGPDADTNFSLRLAVQRARDNNMPLDNIDRAIKKASGDGGNADDLLESDLRRLRPRRRGPDAPGRHGQQEPHRGGGPQYPHPQRRQPGGDRLRGLELRLQGRDHDRTGDRKTPRKWPLRPSTLGPTT